MVISLFLGWMWTVYLEAIRLAIGALCLRTIPAFEKLWIKRTERARKEAGDLGGADVRDYPFLSSREMEDARLKALARQACRGKHARRPPVPDISPICASLAGGFRADPRNRAQNCRRKRTSLSNNSRMSGMLYFLIIIRSIPSPKA